MLSNPYQAYQKQAVTTSRPEDLTAMLFQGLGKFIRLAKSELENGNMEASHQNNIKAQDIITELMVTLNKDYPVASQLLPVYDYMKTRLIEANMKKNSDIFDEIEGYASELANTWSAAVKASRAGLG